MYLRVFDDPFHDMVKKPEVAEFLIAVEICAMIGRKKVKIVSSYLQRPLVIWVDNTKEESRSDLNKLRRAGFKVQELSV